MKPTIIREVEHYRGAAWHVTADKGETRESILAPTFWAHIASRLRPLARIEVFAADGSWFSELIVRSVGPTGARPTEARVVELRHVDLDAADAVSRDVAPDTSLEAVWKGPSVKWVAQRKGDKMVQESGFGSKADAEAWIANPVKRAEAA